MYHYHAQVKKKKKKANLQVKLVLQIVYKHLHTMIGVLTKQCPPWRCLLSLAAWTIPLLVINNSTDRLVGLVALENQVCIHFSIHLFFFHPPLPWYLSLFLCFFFLHIHQSIPQCLTYHWDTPVWGRVFPQSERRRADPRWTGVSLSPGSPARLVCVPCL